MAGRNEAKITFRAETEQFNNQIKNANSTLATLRATMALNQAQFKNTGDAAEYLKGKQELLKQELEQNRAKQEALTGKLEAAKKIYGENSTEAQKLVAQLTRTQTEEQRLESQLSDTTEALEDMADAEEKANTPLEKLKSTIEEQKSELDKLQTEYANTALQEGRQSDAAQELRNRINTLNSELRQNEERLEDVQSATREAGEEMDEQSKGGWTQGQQVLADLKSKVLGGLIDTMKQAVSAVIELGTEFTKSLSNVEALSGASASEMDKLESTALELGRSTVFSASQVSDAFGYMALAGWETSDMLNGIDGVLNLAATSGMELADASDMVTDYLSAFGLEAQDAAGMVDMLAYAQANSNTTAEQLGEAFGNSASMMHTAGQSMQTTTAILEAFANQGLKGSEAGTALSAMMRDITQKMKNGKIMIGDTAVEVQDANGNFRNMIDILADVEDATDGMGTAEKSAALMTTFTARSVKGVSMALTEGSENLQAYEEDLNSCSGTAEDMSGIMNDNLAGDMKALDSAMEGLGLQLFSFFEGPLREGAQFATDAINGITDALTPHRTELETFIDGINESVDKTKEAVEASTERVGHVTDGVAELQAYRDIILDLNEKSELNEYEQYQMKNAVEALSGSMPELANAFDEVTGKLDLTNTELEDMFDNALKLALQDAIIKEIQAAYDTMAQAELDAAMATDALTTAQQNAGMSYDEVKKKAEDFAKAGINISYALTQEEKELLQAGGAQAKTNEAREETNRVMGENVEQLKAVAKEQEAEIDENIMQAQTSEDVAAAVKDAADAAVDAADANEDLGEAVGITAEDLASLAEQTGLSIDELSRMAESSDMTVEELEKVATKVAEERKAFEDLQTSVQEATSNSITALQEWSGGAELSIDDMVKNITDATAGAQAWVDNMTKLGQEAGGAIPQALYDELLEQGPTQAANAAAALADALDNEKDKVKAIADEYAKQLDITADSTTLAKYSSTGKAVTGEIAKGVEDGSAEVADAAGQMTDDINTEVDNGMDDVVSTYDGAMDAMESSTSTSANIIETRVSQMVLNLKKKLAEEIKGPNFKLPHFKLTGEFNPQAKTVPVVTVDWYAKGGIFTRPTVLGTPYGLKGFGESGAEAVLPVELLRDYVSEAVSAASNTVFNIEMTVNGAESPEAWAADFARSLKQRMRIA